MKQLARLVLIALLALALISLLATCANPIGTHTSTNANQSPAVLQPAAAGGTSIQADPQADSIEQDLTNLDNQLKSTDTVDDLQ